MNNDMNEQMLESIAEERGYDRGFTAGTLHAHNLLDKYLQALKQQRSVYESEYMFESRVHDTQKQINAIEYAKQVIRTGHWDDDTMGMLPR
jgi:hypothetical protein